MALLAVMAREGLAAEYRLRAGGAVSLGDGLEMSVAAAPAGWKGAQAVMVGIASPDDETGSVEWRLKRENDVFGRGRTTLLPLADGRVLCRFSVRMEKDFPSEYMCAALRLPAADYARAEWTTGSGARGVFPAKWEKQSPVPAPLDRLAVVSRKGRRLSLLAVTGWGMDVQDDRRWMPEFTVRAFLASGLLKRGVTYQTELFLEETGTVAVRYDGAARIVAGETWIPLDNRKEIVPGSALDLSAFPFRDAPAGRHGRLKADRGRFFFADSPALSQRFWGANVYGPMNCPEPTVGARLLDRLERGGFNSIRFHDLERILLAKSKDGRTFNAENLDRFDRFFAEAKKRGFYLSTDLFVGRRIAWRDFGVERDGTVGINVAKGLFLADERGFSVWAQFADDFLRHVNPHTGLSYADDPALAFLALVNEGSFAWNTGAFDTEAVRKVWKVWLKNRRRADQAAFPEAPEDCAGHSLRMPSDKAHPALFAFVGDLERRFVRRARKHLRDLGCEALLTDWNCGELKGGIATAVTNELDYVDMHFYVDHPKSLGTGGEIPSVCDNTPPQAFKFAMPFDAAKVARQAGRPFAVSEWNFVTPGACRGAAGLVTGAVAARRDWNALWRYCFVVDPVELADETPLSFFSMSADPFQIASDRVGVLLYLRRETGTSDVEGTGSFPLAVDSKTGTFSVTARQTSGGFVRAGGTIRAGGFVCQLDRADATVWVTALDDQPLKSSRRILLAHLTDLQSEGSRIKDGATRILEKQGRGKSLVKRGVAVCTVSLDEPEAYAVHALGTDGARLDRVPTAHQAGKLTFAADVKGPDGKARCLYEIVRSDK